MAIISDQAYAVKICAYVSRFLRLVLLMPLLSAALRLSADPIGDALNQPGLAWQTSPANAWTVQTTVTHDGVSALFRYAYNTDDKGTVSVTVNGPLQVSFWWKCTQLQSFGSFSFLAADANDASAPQVYRENTGSADWQQVSVGIDPGPHVLTWTINRAQGWLDEVGFGDRLPEAPTVGAPSFPQAALAGATVKLSATTGGFPLFLQWLKDGQPVPGATNSSLVISNAPASVTGQYQLVASNQLGVVSSQTTAVYLAQPFTLTPLATYTITNGTILNVGLSLMPATNSVRPGRNQPRPKDDTPIWVRAMNQGLDLWAARKSSGHGEFAFDHLIFAEGKLNSVSSSPSPAAAKPASYYGKDNNGVTTVNTFAATGTQGVYLLRTLASPDAPSLPGNYTYLKPAGNVLSVGISDVSGQTPLLVVLTDTAILAYPLKPDGSVDASSPPKSVSLASLGLVATVMSVDKDKIALGSGTGVTVLKIGTDGTLSFFAAVPKDPTFNIGASQVAIQAGTPGTSEPDQLTVINPAGNIGSTYGLITGPTGQVAVGARASFAPNNDLNRSANITDAAQQANVAVSGVQVPNVGGRVMLYDTGVATTPGAFKNPLLVGSAPCGGGPNDPVSVASLWPFICTGSGDMLTVFVATPTGQPPVIIGQPANAVITSQGVVNLFVKAAGDPPLSYQWIKQKNGAELPISLPFGGTTTEATLSLPGIDFNPPLGTQPGTTLIDPSVLADYFVRVTNPYGHTDSQLVTVSRAVPTAPQLSAKGTADGGVEFSFSPDSSGAVLQFNFSDPGNAAAWQPANKTPTEENGVMKLKIQPMDLTAEQRFFARLFLPGP